MWWSSRECLGTQIPERDMVQQCTMKSVTLNYNYCHRVPPEWAKGDLPQLDLDWLRKRICATLGQEFWFNAQKVKWFCSTFCLFRKLFQKKLMVFRGGSNISGVSIGWWSYQLQLLLLLMSTRRPLLGNASEKTICIHSIRSKLDFPSHKIKHVLKICCNFLQIQSWWTDPCLCQYWRCQHHPKKEASQLVSRKMKPGCNLFLKNSTLGIPQCKIFARALFYGLVDITTFKVIPPFRFCISVLSFLYGQHLVVIEIHE